MEILFEHQPSQNYENITGTFDYDGTTAHFTYPTNIVKISIFKIGMPLVSEFIFQEYAHYRIKNLTYTIGLPIYYIYINPTTKFAATIEKLYLNKEYKKRTIQFKLLRPYTTPEQNFELEELTFNIFKITKSTINPLEIGNYGYLIIGLSPTLENLLNSSRNKYNKKQENLSFSEFLRWIINKPITAYTDKHTTFYNFTIPSTESYLSYLQNLFTTYNNYLFFYDEVKKQYILDKLPFSPNNYASYGKIFKNNTLPDYIIKENLSKISSYITYKNLFLTAHTYYNYQILDKYNVNYITFITPHTFNIGELIIEAQTEEPYGNPHLIVSLNTNYTHIITEDTHKYFPIKITKLITISTT